MAQLLIYMKDNIHNDPTKDEAASYKTGDVVSVQDDSHVWGNAEVIFPFEVVSVVGSVSDWDYLLAPVFDSNSEVSCRRAYKWVDGAVLK